MSAGTWVFCGINNHNEEILAGAFGVAKKEGKKKGDRNSSTVNPAEKAGFRMNGVMVKLVIHREKHIIYRRFPIPFVFSDNHIDEL